VYAYSPRARGSTPDPSYAYPRDVERLITTSFSSTDRLVTLALGSPVDVANWRIARDLGLNVFSHVNDEAAGAQVEAAHDLGLVGPWNTFIHCTGLADSTWRTIGSAGAKVSLSNLVEQTLCTGWPGLQAALDHGIRPSFSTDAVSLGPTDFFSQMRAAYALQRSRLQERTIRGDDDGAPYLNTRDILEMATIEGARAAHVEDRIGSLTPGKEADVVILNARTLNAAPVNHAAGAIVMLMDTSNVESVIVRGRFVKRDHQLVGVDVDAVAQALERTVEGLMTRSGSRSVVTASCRGD
jgi:5-methylthioadenosine/S-adenosylhomocysteine deaminase